MVTRIIILPDTVYTTKIIQLLHFSIQLLINFYTWLNELLSWVYNRNVLQYVLIHSFKGYHRNEMERMISEPLKHARNVCCVNFVWQINSKCGPCSFLWPEEKCARAGVTFSQNRLVMIILRYVIKIVNYFLFEDQTLLENFSL